MGLVTLIVYAIAVLGGWVNAALWSQVTILWEEGWTIANWHDPAPEPMDGTVEMRGSNTYYSAHRLRFFLTYPVFWLSAQMGIGYDTLYAAIVPLLAALSAWSVAAVVIHRSGHALHLISLMALLPVICIFSMMEGRLIFAHCGYAVLLASHLGSLERKPYLVAIGSAIGLLLTSVASGTFFSAFLALILLSCAAAVMARGLINRLLRLAPLVLCLLLYNADIYGALIKNFAFFGGGPGAVINMLQHGIGAVILKAGKFTMVSGLICLVTVAGLGAALYRFRAQLELRLCFVLLGALAMGMFGLSALTLALIPTCVLAAVTAQRFFLGIPAHQTEPSGPFPDPA
ncbi:hypothetical protein [uncultured Roseobacter sp.]|uniref:hypothetical protein n=1 Tax=uncultured Roseobacter sp. TaxID=114847 RepID=UPI00261CA88E|nr:hypothetical protein [uncultured Roseobacter sp.]